MTEENTGPGRITARLFTDPSCPFGYSANPALRTIEWRYRDQIDWQLVMISLSGPEPPSHGMSPATIAGHWIGLRESHGMPFAAEPKLRDNTSYRACQAIIAARLIQPGSEWRTLRALQLLQFNSPLLLDDLDQLRSALGSVDGLDADRIVDALDSDEVQEAWRSDRDRARSAEGGSSHLQGRTADDPEGVRYTAPSVIFEAGLLRLEVGGFQPVEAYDAAIANLDPTLNRNDPAESALDALALYPSGLTTQEIAAIMAANNVVPDRDEAEHELVGALADGKVKRVALGSDALWLAA
jgi:predicted DsbA family dithiol-disulfide isomerase